MSLVNSYQRLWPWYFAENAPVLAGACVRMRPATFLSQSERSTFSMYKTSYVLNSTLFTTQFCPQSIDGAFINKLVLQAILDYILQKLNYGFFLYYLLHIIKAKVCLFVFSRQNWTTGLFVFLHRDQQSWKMGKQISHSFQKILVGIFDGYHKFSTRMKPATELV